MPAPTTLKLGVAQPRLADNPEPAAAVGQAVQLLRAAAATGVQLLVFPESYPGPLRVEDDYDALPDLAEVATDTGCAVYFGRVERGDDGVHETVGYLLGTDDGEPVRYPRSHPATGDVHPRLNGAPMAPGDALCTADVHGVRVGLLVCSELWLPEPARILALRGAEVLLAPAGGGFGPVAGNWQLMARARAIENQCYVALTQNLIGDETGTALIAGPERDVASASVEPLVTGTLDLARARWLRSQDDSMVVPKPFSSLPGLLRARRPSLYGELTRVDPAGYDYLAALAYTPAAHGREAVHEAQP